MENTAKELKKSPFRENDKEYQKLADKINKIIENSDKETELEKLLDKTEDAVELSIIGSILNELGIKNQAEKFYVKAKQNGYDIMENKLQKFKFKYKLNINSTQNFDILDDRLQQIFDELDNEYAENGEPYIEEYALIPLVSPTNEAYITAAGKQEVRRYLYELVDKYLFNVNEYSEKENLNFYFNDFVKFTTENNLTNENHKQQFLYKPNEETIWKETDENVEQTKFNDTALKQLISDDYFLKFAYSNIYSGDEQKDLEKIYDTYIKDDELLKSKLNTYTDYISFKLNNK